MTDDSAAIRVLVVDDHRAIRRALCLLLHAEGYWTADADSVPAARERLTESQFDIVLLDVDMPGEKGTALLPELSKLAPHTVPIMVTGSDDAGTAVAALKQGAFDYICKPFTNEQVFEAIHQALRQRDQVIRDQGTAGDLEALLQERTDDLYRALGRLEDAQAAIQRVACSLAEIRDAETGAHLRRMAVYARELARALPEHVRQAHGIDRTYIEVLFDAAPLHDIGKIGVPDQILLKPGPLTDNEWQTMMRHSEIGRAILQTAGATMGPECPPVLEIGIEICASHHEHYDGSGYPEGLRGDDIPISARIIAVADVYDALATLRPYRREALSHEQVRDMIINECGRAFDPAVIEAFLGAEFSMAAISQGIFEEASAERDDSPDGIADAALDSADAVPDAWVGRAFVDTARDLGLIS